MNRDTHASYLDKDGNRALNQALEKKTDEEKYLLKSILDLTIHTEFKNGKPCYIENDNMSKEEVVSKLLTQVKEQKQLEISNISGLVEVMEKFIKYYNNSEALTMAK